MRKCTLKYFDAKLFSLMQLLIKYRNEMKDDSSLDNNNNNNNTNKPLSSAAVIAVHHLTALHTNLAD